MPLSRRRLLTAAAIVPVVVAAERAIGHVVDGARSAAAAFRPAPAGTSATRCGLCGGTDHTMLDQSCPAARPLV